MLYKIKHPWSVRKFTKLAELQPNGGTIYIRREHVLNENSAIRGNNRYFSNPIPKHVNENVLKFKITKNTAIFGYTQPGLAVISDSYGYGNAQVYRRSKTELFRITSVLNRTLLLNEMYLRPKNYVILPVLFKLQQNVL